MAVGSIGRIGVMHGKHWLDYNGNALPGSDQRYTPFGSPRITGSVLPSKYTFTGQRSFMDEIGTMDYGARQYSPLLGRFLSADTVVPGAGNPQAFNRYSYVLNRPLNYTDPSGHDPLDAQWHIDFFRANGRLPGEEDYRNRLFSLLFEGSGKNGAWTAEDWAFYAENRDDLWNAQTEWQNKNGAADPRFHAQAGMDSFVGHMERLSTYYEKGEEAQFVGAIGALYAHVPYNADRVTGAATAAARIRTGIGSLQEAQAGSHMNGWNPSFTDAQHPGIDQIHHYAAYLYMGYNFGSVVGGALAVAQDISPLNAPDILLGNIGVMHGEALANGKLTMSALPTAIRKRLGGP